MASTADKVATTVNGTLPPPENKLFYPALNGLRAVAVLLVFSEHYLKNIFPLYLQIGWGGVDIFFVLSGFLITGILYDTRSTPHRYRNFYVRRTLRIFPLYYGTFLFVLLTLPFFHWNSFPGMYLWPTYLGNLARFLYIDNYMALQKHGLSMELFVSKTLPWFRWNIGHFWSLAIEEQFYLIWPFVVFSITNRKRLKQICIFFLIAAPLLRLAGYFLLPHNLIAAEWNYRFTLVRVDALLLGALLALGMRGTQIEKTKLLRLGTPLALGGFAIFFAGWVIASAFGCYAWVETLGYTFFDLGCAGLVLLCIQQGTRVHQLLTKKRLQQLGAISYGFYVFHVLLLSVYGHLFNRLTAHVWHHPTRVQTIAEAAFAFLCTVTISYLSFRFFESPFLRLKDRFAPS